MTQDILSTEKRCGNCAHYLVLEGDPPPEGSGIEDETEGECRRFLPVLFSTQDRDANVEGLRTWRQPWVCAEDYCGEWRAVVQP